MGKTIENTIENYVCKHNRKLFLMLLPREMQSCYFGIQWALCICKFRIHGFNQWWTENIPKKKSKKFQKAKLEFATCQQLFT